MLSTFLNGVIRFSLLQRVPVITLAFLLVVFGSWQVVQLPIDVFPNLNRPRVVVMVEAPGLAPEEVETLITIPLESAINGATGVQAVRSQSGVGLSVIYVDFEWDTDIYNDRQIVAERLQLALNRLPPGVTPQLAPISSIMGQIMIIGMWSENQETSPLQLRTLADWEVRQRLLAIPGVSQVFVMGGDRQQFQVLVDPLKLLRFGVTLHEVKVALQESNENATGGYLDEQGPHELLVRSLGRVQTIEDLEKIVIATREGRTILVREVARVLAGPEVKRGDSAAFVRTSSGDFVGGPAVLLTVNKQPAVDTRQVTSQIERALREVKTNLPPDVQIHPDLYQQQTFIDLAIENVVEALRDGGLLVVIILFLFLLNFRTTFITLTAIPLSIVTTGFVFAALGLSINTMTLGGLAVAIGELVDDAIVDVENILRRLRQNRRRANPQPNLLVVFQASAEIRNSIVYGTVIVALVFVPVFALSGMEGRLFVPLGIAYIVSILSSLLVSLTVTPALSYWILSGQTVWRWLAGLLAPFINLGTIRWLIPLGLQIAGQSAVAERWQAGPWWLHGVFALAVAPVTWWLLVYAEQNLDRAEEGRFLRWLQSLAGAAIRFSLRQPKMLLSIALGCVMLSAVGLTYLERDFLPPFNEGAVQINVVLPPGTSLETSQEVARSVEQSLMRLDSIRAFVRKTGRAELDEHAIPVNMTEVIATLNPQSDQSRAEILEEIRSALSAEQIPGIVTSVEQPLGHLISSMLSGVQSQIAIKLFGDDLSILRREAREIQSLVANVPGVVDLQIEPQVEIPQLRIELEADQLQKYGLRRAEINEFVETAMNGIAVSEVLLGQRTFDLLVRLDEAFREDIDSVRRLTVNLPDGSTTSLGSVAKIYRSSGPNTINREQARRRIVIQANAAGRGLVDVVQDIEARLQPLQQDLPTGYFIEYSGQFESQQSASRIIFGLFALALVGVFLVLFTMFRSALLAIQVLIAVPTALIGSVAALYLTQQTLSVAAMVGFISLCGIASRNGILLINHYLHLVQHEQETWSKEMVVRAGQERVAPVLMTALTSGIGLIPLALAAGQPGKEILYPIATVIIGGLLSSTLLEFFVRPALFWQFGVNAARRALERQQTDDALREAMSES